jgi:phosphoribosylformimino-5-aminoimidazole carboxamide ribotide isomerase
MLASIGRGRSAVCVCASSSPTRASGTGRNRVGFRPCIDIHDGRVKQIVGSTLADLPKNDSETRQAEALETNFESDLGGAHYAELYRSSGLLGGHVIMLGANEDSKKQALSALKAYPGGLQLGGGVTTANAMEYLDAGASHVIVTSFVFRDGELDRDRLNSLVELVGKDRIVLDLSCRKKDDGKYYVVTDRWQKFSNLCVDEATLDDLASCCDEFLVHGVDVEGKKLGVDDDLVELLGKCSGVPCTYAGGATTMEDLERVAIRGSGRVEVTVGSALDIFGGNLKYDDVVKWHNSKQ